jgi:hypothetical protein
MISEFPKFDNLEYEHKQEVENFTASQEPYSDFNFTSMWSWNVKNQMRLSKLNNNLVVKFTDYVSGKPFYSFLGVTKVDDTVTQLMNLSRAEGITPELKLLTEETIKATTPEMFSIKEDRDNFDYILSVERLKQFQGTRFASKRNYLRKFKDRNPSAEVRRINLAEKGIQKKVMDLFDTWHANKSPDMSYAVQEFKALSRFLEMPVSSTHISIGAFIGDELAAFWLLEKIKKNFCISHYEKANVRDFIGAYPYLVNESAKLLAEEEIKYINFEQDLGIEGLRESKRSYDPCAYLRQYVLNSRE